MLQSILTIYEDKDKENIYSQFNIDKIELKEFVNKISSDKEF
ncbi:hypothetical protein O5404_05175 (plasmid) [Borrelia miyamotoi]|uniref:DUF685 domain-containing protein n=1 Tax=Borrelia miyamotoi TaxID=47466 RepID=A0AAX3JNC8_9SPIR|nr:hypothetical protein [Borrelia miyamotoi]WAZ72416.1 hypothetical protein O5404_05175 [Borrelia miyamotoi]WVI05338.1 hypothetical protein F9Y91_00535 [Borrelia miyamotoi]